MQDFRPVGYVVGLMVMALGLAMCLPMFVDLAEGAEHWLVFAQSAALTLIIGGLLAWAVGQVILSKRTPSLVDRDKASIDQPAVHLVLVAIAYMIVAGIHMALGVSPFGGV